MSPHFWGPRVGYRCSNCEATTWISAESFREREWIQSLRCSVCGNHLPLSCPHHGLLLTQKHEEFARSEPGPAVCSVCGFVAAKFLGGQTLGVEPVRASTSSPALNRFDCVLFRAPSEPLPQLKRIWALPGEAIRFEAGELWVNDQLYQKSLAELLQVAIPVASLDEPVGIWQYGLQEEARTRKASLRRSQALHISAGESLYWEYAKPAAIHREESSEFPLQTSWLEARPLDDDLALNASASYQLQRVDDFLIDLRLRSAHPTRCLLQTQYQGHALSWSLTISSSNTPTPAESYGGVAQQHTRSHPDLSKPIPVQMHRSVLIACCDQRILVSSDLESFVIALTPEQLVHSAGNSGTMKLELEAESALSVDRFSILRDTHLREDIPTSARIAQGNLGPAYSDRSGYFVIGDNLPVSLDSRNGLGRISQNDIFARITEPTNP